MSNPYNILIVEDAVLNGRIEDYIRSHCTKHLGQVLHVDSEGAFLAALDEHEWDIVLSDFNLKNFSAEKALQITNRRGLDLPCIVITDQESEPAVMDVLYAGAEHVISRDDIERLCITVPRSIANARRRRDVTRELVSHRHLLEEQVAARTAELELLNEQLKREIRAREQVAEKLRRSELQYRKLFENVHDGICIVQDRTLQFVNRRLEQILGYDEKMTVGTGVFDYFPAEEKAGMLDVYRRIITGDADMLQADTVLIKKNGQRIDVNISASTIEYNGKRGVMVMVRDITERKRVARITVENEKLDAVGVVARGVGNNLTNIMNIISSNASIITDSLLTHSRAHDAACKIMEAAGHAGSLAKRLLSVVQFSQGAEVKANLGPVSLSEVIERAAGMVAYELQTNGIELRIKKPGSLPEVIADRNQLIDTLLSIFMNAIDAMPEGGTLAVKAIARKISRPRANPNSSGGRFVGISIHDDGIGMTREEVARAFEPFYTTKSSKDAFGLGLPVAQSMALSWGGWLDIRSRPGKGTRVRIFVPKSEGSSAGAGGRHRLKDKMNILVVDDNEGRRRMIVDTLKMHGHKVVECADGEKALDIYRKSSNNIDICIIDWLLPGIDGGEVVKAVYDENTQARVIMASGFSRDYVRSQIRIGSWGFLQKPFSEDELMREVDKVCRGGR